MSGSLALNFLRYKFVRITIFEDFVEFYKQFSACVLCTVGVACLFDKYRPNVVHSSLQLSAYCEGISSESFLRIWRQLCTRMLSVNVLALRG